MILLDQAVKELFMPGLSGQAELNGLELFHCGDNSRLVDIEILSFFTFGFPTAGKGFFPGRKCNVTLPMKLQHEFSADPILEHTVGLCPIPFAANCQGQRSTTFIRIVGDELTKEVDVAGAYVTFTVSKYRSHGENITDIVVDRTLFF
jgi:hypothetical protein